MKKMWIYELRGLSIIAVVVCHQQYILHTSEWVQLLSLFSVTTLIFLAGMTAAISLRNRSHSFDEKNNGITYYTVKKVFPIFSAYCISTVAYLSQQNLWVGEEFDVLANALINFSASGPFYFIRYYICLTFISPVIYGIIKKIKIVFLKSYTLVCGILLIVLFAIGYIMQGEINFLGGSYLAVYALGLMGGGRYIC